MAEPHCRFCSAPLRRTFLDLGSSPLANAFRTAAQLREPEAFLPLHAYVCEACFLVQLEDVETPEHIFSDYLYFSSFSNSWVEHARRYVEATIPRFGLGAESFVVELASNDGYLLQWFVARGVPRAGDRACGERGRRRGGARRAVARRVLRRGVRDQARG